MCLEHQNLTRSDNCISLLVRVWLRATEGQVARSSKMQGSVTMKRTGWYVSAHMEMSLVMLISINDWVPLDMHADKQE
jgi:hypothetical protein